LAEVNYNKKQKSINVRLNNIQNNIVQKRFLPKSLVRDFLGMSGACPNRWRPRIRPAIGETAEHKGSYREV